MILINISLIILTISSSVLDHLTLKNDLHYYSPEISKQISSSIKIQLVQNIKKISNKTLSKQLVEDLFQDEDSKRTLTQIDIASCREIFIIFNLKPPICDNNYNGIVENKELKCLNKIWKYYIPGDQYY